MGSVGRNDILRWAESRTADQEFPRLIRRLILATDRGVERLVFRADEGVALGGWDGVAITSTGSAWVPLGPSGWELSTQTNVKAKASDDYTKRTANPGGLNPAETAFIFATPRPFPSREAWEQERSGSGPWRDVRVIDVDELVSWLEDAPPVELWFSSLVGKPPGIAQDLEGFGQSWSEATTPAFSDALLASGREDETQRVQEWLRGPPSVLVLRGETEDESIAFLSASIKSLPGAEFESAAARAAVVNDLATWRELMGSRHPYVLVPNFADRADSTAAAARGHHVLVPVARDFQLIASAHQEVVLPRLRVDAARAAMQAMGIEERRLDVLSDRARRGVPILRRELGALVRPRWAQPQEARTLVAASLAGRWTGDNKDDQMALEQLSGRGYEEFNSALLRWSNEPDRPVRLVGRTWLVTSREDSWSLLARFVGGSDLELLETVVLRVVGEPDPRFDLPEDQRWMAAVHGASPRHSSALKEGLADTLALMAGVGELYPPGDSVTGPAWACRIVHKLLQGLLDWKAWASLSWNLPSVAEACPEAFLDAVEQDISQTEPVLVAMFGDESAFGGSSPHTGLLWALERLAWSPQYLPRVTTILGRLVELDPEGKTSPRPSTTLHEIFLLWRPGTTGTLEERFSSLDALRKGSPQAAWDVLIDLIPSSHEIATPTSEPRWRDWAAAERGVSRQELRNGIHELVSRLLVDVNLTPSRWTQLIPKLDDLPVVLFDEAVNALEILARGGLGAEDQVAVRDSLRRVISHHAKFPDADWVLPAPQLERLRDVYSLLESDDPVERARLLFSYQPVLLDSTSGGWEERRQIAARRQDEAARSLVEVGGLEALFTLAKASEDPWTVGLAVARGGSEVSDVEVLTESLEASPEAVRSLALGLVSGRISERGEEWVNTVLADPSTHAWTDVMRGRMFILMPIGRQTWDRLSQETPEVQDAYWREVRVHGWGQEVPTEIVEAAVAELQRRGRFAAAVDLLGLYGSGANPAVIANALDLFATNGAEGEYSSSHLSYEIADLLSRLEPTPELSLNEIARLEWIFLELQGHGKFEALKLHEGLATDPALFVDVLKLAYREEVESEATSLKESDEEEAEGEEPVSPDQQSLASRAFKLLYEWRRPPGLDSEGRIDPVVVREWVGRVRELAAQEGRARAADHWIGQILVSLPEGDDGVRPPPVVRDLFEDLTSRELENGYYFGALNSRGMTTRASYEGGAQERELSRRYHADADATVSWPRTSRLLRALGDRYEAEARQEDSRAELNEEGIW